MQDIEQEKETAILLEKLRSELEQERRRTMRLHRLRYAVEEEVKQIVLHKDLENIANLLERGPKQLR